MEDTDSYGRLIARVVVEGGSLSKMLVRDGLAWHHDRYAPNADELSRLEQRAHNANRGLWYQPAPTPPWPWRDEPQQQGWVERYLGSSQLLIDPYLPEGVSLTALQYISSRLSSRRNDLFSSLLAPLSQGLFGLNCRPLYRMSFQTSTPRSPTCAQFPDKKRGAKTVMNGEACFHKEPIKATRTSLTGPSSSCFCIPG